MTKRLTDAQMAKADAIEIQRTAINLKYRLLARRERNDVLPDLEENIDRAISGGPRLELNAGRVFDETLWGKNDEQNDANDTTSD